MNRPTLRIDRIAVEEGFLDGLELDFSPGLNVIIGARGVGKTSVIELLRFCLGVPALTDRFRSSASEHAQAVLDGGRVTVICSVDDETFVVSRQADDDEPQIGIEWRSPKPIILSQNEIEAVGLDARGRLRLLDGFRGEVGALVSREAAALSRVEALSAEVTRLDDEVLAMAEELEDLEEARELLASATRQAAENEEAMEQAGGSFGELERLGELRAERSVRVAALTGAIQRLEGWLEDLRTVERSAPALEEWPDETEDPFDTARKQIAQVRRSLGSGENELSKAVEALRDHLRDEEGAGRVDDEKARELRREAESLKEGAGVALRTVTALRERVAKLERLQDLRAERLKQLEERREARREALAELEEVRSERFDARRAVADELNAVLQPDIRIEVKRAGLSSDYAQAISEVLRGSGLHYTKLAPRLAERLAPEELVGAVEAGELDLLSQAGGISSERAERVAERIRAAGSAQVLSAPIEDAAIFCLREGAEDYKPTTGLSTGQRCTVVLPILLQHHGRPLVIDQPEDHLDNAFVVDTLVRTLEQRAGAGQTIVSTHNPNIPVLGDAECVVVLDSDGRRGFKRLAGPLLTAPIVDAITTIMEGGREAFDQRAAFYRERRTSDDA